jgi:hypothetical protein
VGLGSEKRQDVRLPGAPRPLDDDQLRLVEQNSVEGGFEVALDSLCTNT